MSGIKGQKGLKRVMVDATYTPSFLDELDGRCRVAKLIRGRFTTLVGDQGGLSHLSYQRQSLCWRFLHLEAWIENQEQALAEGKKIDEARYLASLNSYVGLLARLGLERRATPVQSLDAYLAGPPPHEQPEELA
ncbi:MAG: hypothetical protein MRJ68_12585 [Nitrospira sp.]|nr:hypothetical protein [Nitrospira sp.]